MKSASMLTVATALAAGEANALLNLKDHHLLSTEEKITPFESIAYIDTYDEVPVFGGLELRQKMLKKATEAKEHMFGLEIDTAQIASTMHQGLEKASRQISS